MFLCYGLSRECVYTLRPFDLLPVHGLRILCPGVGLFAALSGHADWQKTGSC